MSAMTIAVAVTAETVAGLAEPVFVEIIDQSPLRDPAINAALCVPKRAKGSHAWKDSGAIPAITAARPDRSGWQDEHECASARRQHTTRKRNLPELRYFLCKVPFTMRDEWTFEPSESRWRAWRGLRS